MMKKTELQTMVVSELKALAKKMKLTLPLGARKSSIVELLAAAFNKNAGEQTVTSRAKSADTKRNVAEKKTSVVKKSVTVKRSPAPKSPAAGTGAGREWKMPPGAEEPLLAQERVSDAKYYTGPAQEQRPSAEPYAELSAGYGEEKISMMVRDPYLAYVYWEMTSSRVEREKGWFGWNAKLAIRVYDVTGVQFNGQNAIGYFDQEVKELIGSWYFDLGRPSHSFVTDVGLLSPEGRFLTLARSNYVMMPRDGVSDVVDEEWMLVDEEFWKLYGFPGGPSSPQLQEMMRLRRMQQITSPGTFSRSKRK